MSANPTTVDDAASASPPVAQPVSRRMLIVQILLLVVVTVGMLAAIPFADEIRAREGSSYLALFVLSVWSGALFMLPGFGWAGIAAFTVALDNVWGPVLVGTTGQVIGEMVSYFLGVTGSPWIQRNRHYPRVEGWLRRWGLLAIAVIAAIPNPFFDIAGAVAGAARLGWWRFFIASWIGRLVKNLGFGLLGLGSADFIRGIIG